MGDRKRLERVKNTNNPNLKSDLKKISDLCHFAMYGINGDICEVKIKPPPSLSSCVLVGFFAVCCSGFVFVYFFFSVDW